MPKKYLYTKPTAAEVVAKMRAANLSVSDMVKLTGRHYSQVKQMMGEGDQLTPNMAETVLLDYLEEYPNAAEIMLDMAEVRILGQQESELVRQRNEERLKARFGSAYIPPERRKP